MHLNLHYVWYTTYDKYCNETYHTDITIKKLWTLRHYVVNQLNSIFIVASKIISGQPTATDHTEKSLRVTLNDNNNSQFYRVHTPTQTLDNSEYGRYNNVNMRVRTLRNSDNISKNHSIGFAFSSFPLCILPDGNVIIYLT